MRVAEFLGDCCSSLDAMGRSCAGFSALLDGRPIRCLVTAEALRKLGTKGAGGAALEAAVEAHRPALESLARSMVRCRRVDPARELVITEAELGENSREE